MSNIAITSQENPKIKEIIRLKSSKKKRQTQGLIVVEGLREITLARQAGVKIASLFYCPEFLKNRGLPDIGGNDIYEIAPAIFKKISFRENPDGLFALLRLTETSLKEIKLSKNPLIIVLESVEKPGNLGAILRTADACRADAVLVSGDKTDIYSPNAIRASQGTIFTVPTAIGSQEEIRDFLKNKNISLIATTPAADKVYTEIDYKKPSAILMGSEDQGLSEFWLAAADEKARVPMKGKIDSLNVSVSAAVIAYEALRQRTTG
ncbi:MAG: RNA methyltransferase [Patescibacteria group bacterium]|jgi:TrmH family RNA methyltransferase